MMRSLTPEIRAILLGRRCASITAESAAMTVLQSRGMLDDDFQITKAGEALRRKILARDENKSISLYRVSGPWRRPQDMHQSYDIQGPDMIIAAVFAADGDLAAAERRAKIMAAALDADARNGR
ncbi:MAG: hypothetical protein V4564_07675 [Pseudomonadota bacterium]